MLEAARQSSPFLLFAPNLEQAGQCGTPVYPQAQRTVDDSQVLFRWSGCCRQHQEGQQPGHTPVAIAEGGHSALGDGS